MPAISRFYGVRITMYYAPREHPPAHFHASKGDEEVVMAVATAEVLEGSMNKADLTRVQEWCRLHREELEINWTICMSRQGPLNSIEPLP